MDVTSEPRMDPRRTLHPCLCPVRSEQVLLDTPVGQQGSQVPWIFYGWNLEPSQVQTPELEALRGAQRTIPADGDRKPFVLGQF